ncbi:MAG: hypothetical protein GY901_10230 [Actinomycetia bacterium]|nr:hypothetical protein [Actinomycetes bacterium]
MTTTTTAHHDNETIGQMAVRAREYHMCPTRRPLPPRYWRALDFYNDNKDEHGALIATMTWAEARDAFDI